MDPFLNFPEDKLYELCENLDDESLARFARTSKTINATCQRVINQNIYKIDQLIDELLLRSPTRNDLKPLVFPVMRRNLRRLIRRAIIDPGYYLGNNWENKFKIQKELDPTSNPSSEWDWPLSDILRKYGIETDSILYYNYNNNLLL